jgi:hypothetical protein
MIIKIIEKLKTGSIKKVVAFGDNKLLSIPYTVVKPEKREGTRAFRVIGHFPAKTQTELEDYIFNEVRGLLSDFQATGRNNDLNQLHFNGEYSDFAVTNDDGSISMDIVFEMPFNLMI